MDIQELLETTIYDSQFSPRCKNVLNYAGVKTIGDLVNKSLDEVLRFKHLGRSMLDEIINTITSLGLTFKEKENMEEKNSECIQDETFARQLGFHRATVRFFKRNNIVRLETLADKTGESIFNMKSCTVSIFQNIVDVLDKNGLRLIDCSEEEYPFVSQYVYKFLKAYKENLAERLYSENLKTCYLNDIEELKISSRHITILKKLGIYTVPELLGKTRADLVKTKQFGAKSIIAITDALIKYNITIKGDKIYSCYECNSMFSAPVSLDSTNYCLTCSAKKERIESIDILDVKLSSIEYTGFTSIKSGFDIYANIKNLTDSLLKVKLKDFYVVSKGRQHSPKFYLTGYSFDEELIMPHSVKSAAKIWDLDDFNGIKLKKGDEAYVNLFVSSNNKTLMYKFVLDEDEDWIIDDFFEN